MPNRPAAALAIADTTVPLTVRVKTPEPHSKKQNIAMLAHVTDHLEEVWVACGTKFGKTLAASSSFTVASLRNQWQLGRWVAPYYNQAKIGMNYVRRMLPPEPYTTQNLSRNLLIVPSSDITLQFFHGQNAEALEGEACNGYVLDECAKMKEEVYAAAKTTTTVTRGKFLCISTPLGKNWFWRKCMEAKEEMHRAHFEGRPPRKIFLTAPTAANPKVLASVIAQAKRDLPDRLFRQYYLAEFVDDGGVFEYLAEAFGNAADFTEAQSWYIDGHDSERIFIGADWAKKHDYTVFTALNEAGKMIGYKRMQRRTYPEQVAALYEFARELRARNRLVGSEIRILHDQTGVGEAVADIIDATAPGDMDIQGVVWNNSNKEVAVGNLILALEQTKLELYPWETLRTEMNTFEVTTTMTGRAVYAAAEGCHDDTVMSLVLAVALWKDHARHSTSIITLDTISELIKRVHYNGGVLDVD